jgi:MFS family permease
MHSFNKSNSGSNNLVKPPFYYGWIILIITGLGMFISGPGQTYSISIFMEPMRKTLGLSLSEIASFYTFGSLTAATLMIIVGKLFDIYGGRILMPSITLLFGLACLWMSQVSNSYEIYIGFTMLRALGQGALTLVSTSLVAIWFIQYRGRANAFNSLGSALSQAIFPLLIFYLITNLNWQNTWIILCFIIWGGLLLPAIFIIRRSPESIGLLPDGLTIEQSSNNKISNIEKNWTLKEARKTKTFWLLLFASTSHSFIITALTFLQVPLFESRGLNAESAAQVFMIISPMIILGSFCSGFIIEKIPPRFLLAFSQILLIIAMLFIGVISASWHTFIYGGIIGFGMGFSMTVGNVIWANYYGRKSIGAIRGFVTTIMVGSAALGPLPFALLAEITGSFQQTTMMFTILPLLCLIAAIFAKPPMKI